MRVALELLWSSWGKGFKLGSAQGEGRPWGRGEGRRGEM